MGGGFVNQFLAIWHSLKNDLAQREMLQAAAKDSFGYDSPLRAKVYNEIKWINKRAKDVEEARNRALHSPLWGFDKRKPAVAPVTGLGHRSAQKLSETKELLIEFRWCRDAALVLTDYVKDMDEVLSRDPLPLTVWPDRPSLPNRAQTNNVSKGR
jgi:hypothetical protein